MFLLQLDKEIIMAASRSDISKWFDEGVKSKENPTHMIVVCDTYDHEDYPVYVKPSDEVQKVYEEYNGKNMQRVMEVYKLSEDKESQMNTHRAMNF
jgi:hypothetical protein